MIGEEKITFEQWYGRSRILTDLFTQRGVLPRDRVLCAIAGSFEMAAALTAAWGAGAVPVILDDGYREPQFLHAIETVRPRVVVYAGKTPPVNPDASPCELLCLQNLPEARVLSGSARIPDEQSDSSGRALPSDPASIVFTSGSTGMPKGVVQSHGNLLAGCRTVAGYLGLEDRDRLLCAVPWSYDYGFNQLLTTIVFGITHVLPAVQTPSGICHALEACRPTVLAGVSGVFSFLVGGMSPIETADRRSVRLLTSTGGKLHTPVRERLQSLFGNARLFLNYGLTETYRSCYLPPSSLETHPDSIGIPIPGVDIVIVREDGSLAEAGEKGEIVHRGNHICLGYWGRPEDTARAIRPDPLADPSCNLATRAFYTGDLGYKSGDGYIYYLGRSDNQLKSMGVRVSPDEVETILIRSGMLESVAVFGLEDALLGHEIWAALVPKSAADFSRKDLDRYARKNMSRHMIPRNYLILDELPLTKTGKPDYPRMVEDARRSRETSVKE